MTLLENENDKLIELMCTLSTTLSKQVKILMFYLVSTSHSVILHTLNLIWIVFEGKLKMLGRSDLFLPFSCGTSHFL